MNCTMRHWIYRIIPLTRRLTMASWPDSDVCLSVQTQLPLLRQQCQSKAWMHLLLISLTNGLKNSRATHPAFFMHLIRQVGDAYGAQPLCMEAEAMQQHRIQVAPA